MDLRKLERESFTEYYVTVLGDADWRTPEAARNVFEEMAAAIVTEGIQPFQEKVYGPLDARDEVLRLRHEVFQRAGLDPKLPCTYIAGREGAEMPMAGAQLWGLGGGGTRVTVSSVGGPGGCSGRLAHGPGFEWLSLPAIRGSQSDGTLPEGAAEQARRMFANAENALAANGFRYTDVARTWIYLRRLLDWYGDFNDVRTRFHEEHRITGREGGFAFPASTGIQGTSAGEECLMDVLAIRGNGEAGIEAMPLIRSRRQDQAFDYGSAFSRGMAVAIESQSTVLISGTASIGSDGRTLHFEDREGQIVETLLSIAELIEQLGAGVQDICLGTLFYKDGPTLEAYRRVTRLLGIPRLPLIPVPADVCRPDLLVEIEALATAPGLGLAAARRRGQTREALCKGD